MMRPLAGTAIIGLLLALVVAPYLSLAAMSFFSVNGVVIDRTLTLANYARAVSDPVLAMVLLKTIGLCAAVGAVTTLAAYPVAMLIAGSPGRTRGALLVLFSVPMILSYVLKIYAFRAILGGNGLLNTALIRSGLIDTPSQAFVFNLPAVFLVQTVLFIPFAAFPILLSLDRIPRGLYEAAEDLAAGKMRIFRSVTLPLSRPGVVSAFAFTFLMAIGDFLTPQMVGGPNGFTFSRVIYSQFGLAFNWPFGAVLGLQLALVVGLVLALAAWLGRVPGGPA